MINKKEWKELEKELENVIGSYQKLDKLNRDFIKKLMVYNRIYFLLGIALGITISLWVFTLIK